MTFPSSLPSSALCKTRISKHKTRTICFAAPSAAMSSQTVHRVIYPYDPHTLTWTDGIGLFVAAAQPVGEETRPPMPPPVLSYALEPDHPIVFRWEAVSTEIMEMLSNFGMQWVAIECFRRYQQARGAEDRDTRLFSSQCVNYQRKRKLYGVSCMIFMCCLVSLFLGHVFSCHWLSA
jgi:hypothetical protein